MRIVGPFAAALLLATSAQAASVLPTSYEVQLPNNGVFAYQDDSYSGTNINGFLSGGTGDLTDGTIAAAHWFTTPGPWVGWSDVNPEIVFRFTTGTVINTIDFYFDNAMGAGAVSLPTAVQLSYLGGSINVLPTITTDNILGRYSYDIGSLGLTSLSARLIRSNQWTMLTEVDFTGTNPTAGGVPEPASWAMLIGGFGIIGMAMRRRRATVVAA